MSFPNKLHYTKEHEWLNGSSGEVRVGVTSYAIEQLGDIVHLDLPEVGDQIEASGSFGTIESTKTVSDLYLPAQGQVLEVNKNLLENPESLQDDPYENGWLIKVKLESEPEGLIDASAYEAFIKED